MLFLVVLSHLTDGAVSPLLFLWDSGGASRRASCFGQGFEALASDTFCCVAY